MVHITLEQEAIYLAMIIEENLMRRNAANMSGRPELPVMLTEGNPTIRHFLAVEELAGMALL